MFASFDSKGMALMNIMKLIVVTDNKSMPWAYAWSIKVRIMMNASLRTMNKA
jgi:hypothetical protein